MQIHWLPKESQYCHPPTWGLLQGGTSSWGWWGWCSMSCWNPNRWQSKSRAAKVESYDCGISISDDFGHFAGASRRRDSFWWWKRPPLCFVLQLASLKSNWEGSGLPSRTFKDWFLMTTTHYHKQPQCKAWGLLRSAKKDYVNILKRWRSLVQGFLMPSGLWALGIEVDRDGMNLRIRNSFFSFAGVDFHGGFLLGILDYWMRFF